MVWMSAQEMDSRKLQFFFTLVTRLLVEIASRLFHSDDFTFHGIDIFHMLFYFFIVFVNTINLGFKLA